MSHPTAIRPDTERARLAQLVAWLNAAREGKPVPGMSQAALQQLRDYVESWRECAPNGILWRDRFPAYWRGVCRSLAHTHLILYPAVDGFIPAWDAGPRVSRSDIWRVDKLFADFLAFFNDKVVACQREGCGKYFERKGLKTTYCSERCGKTATSRTAKSEARRNKRHRRMVLVLKCIRELSEGKDRGFLVSDESDERPAWADHVIRKVKGVTDRWLNEAILGRLKTPGSCANCDRCREIRAQIHKVLKG